MDSWRTFTASQYTQLEETQVKSEMRMYFSANAEKTLIVAGSKQDRPRSCLKSNVLNGIMRILPGLRSCPGFTSFDIYPTCSDTMRVNSFLWETVQNGFYDPFAGNELFGQNVFVLGIPAELYDFLIHVTKSAMETAILDFLVLLHHQLMMDGDAAGIEKLKEEIDPNMWAKIESCVGTFENGEPKDADRAATLEHLVQISFMTPWRVDVLAGYLTPHDMANIVRSSPITKAALLSNVGLGSVGVRGSALAKMYQDWLVYEELLCGRLNMDRRAASEAVDRAVYFGRNTSILDEVATVLELANKSESLLSKLPSEVIERSLMPWVVRRNCEAIAPRKRRLATLKSLLELSSKLFDELGLAEFEFSSQLPYEGAFYGGYDAEVTLRNIRIDELAEDGHKSFSSIPCDGNRFGDMNERANTTSESKHYPLNAAPPRYSRLERHGGVIDLTIVPGGLGRLDLDLSLAMFDEDSFSEYEQHPGSQFLI